MKNMDTGLLNSRPFLAIKLVVAIIVVALFGFKPGAAPAQDIADLNCRDHFNPFMPTLVMKYEVNYSLFGLNLVHLADAFIYATDGEWFNEATGEWVNSYLLSLHLDTTEDASEIGRGRYSIHNRLVAVLLKPSLEAIVFAKRDFLHVDTFFAKMEVHNTEIFSVESGKNDYVKKDFVSSSVTTNLDQFAALTKQRNEVLRFLKVVSAVYVGNTNSLAKADDFNISVFTENTLVKFVVKIYPKLEKVNVMDGKFNSVHFKAKPAPGFSGKGRELAAWMAPFRFLAYQINDPALVWMADRTFEWGMVPLVAEYGLRVGTVHCELVRISPEPDFDNVP